MLPKRNRVDKKRVERVFKEGKFINSPHFTFRFIPKTEKLSRISIIVPKTVAKGAVLRNTLRRRGYRALEKHIKRAPSGILGVLILKKQIDLTPEIFNEIENIFNKIN